ncbi:DUF4276 family protein [Micromonospora sp. ATA51]|uniref:DUF4276 family protein n=1 Tax=Micromonospora sp. ATA51 TaxID=2806098 RepID=UPI001A4A731F|nr:DUF4276 family protein [Micromonospora sp. ATA51]MBM0224811.1 DUF4276 family protein [Micromonospora sp. ATA51]
MKVFVITEGVGEYRGLPKLSSQIQASCRNTLKVLKTNVPSDVPVSKVVRQSISNILLAFAENADLVVLLLDREGQDSCCGMVAESIRQELVLSVGNRYSDKIHVVLKDRKFENWLVADLDALKAQPARFKVTPAVVKKVAPNKADAIDAERLLKSIIIGGHYEKVADSSRICERLTVEQAAANSRSFRHFLHIIGHPAYSDGCRAPARIPGQRSPGRNARQQ